MQQANTPKQTAAQVACPIDHIRVGQRHRRDLGDLAGYRPPTRRRSQSPTPQMETPPAFTAPAGALEFLQMTDDNVTHTPTTPTAQAFDGSNSLTDLRERLKAEHAAVGKALKTSLAHAMAAGDILIEAKVQLGKHGEWLPWLESCGLSERTSQRYMRLARHRNIVEANPSGLSDLSVGGALALLAVPRKSGDDLVDGLADLADLAGETAFDLWDHLGADKRSNEQTELRMALHAEAQAAVERIVALATTPELVKIIDEASGDLCERLEAGCAEFRAAVAGEMGITQSELAEMQADLAERRAPGFFWGKWRHILIATRASPRGLPPPSSRRCATSPTSGRGTSRLMRALPLEPAMEVRS